MIPTDIKYQCNKKYLRQSIRGQRNILDSLKLAIRQFLA